MNTLASELYQYDVAQDVRDYYKDRLHRGKTGVEITRELIDHNKAVLFDIDDAPIFWFALADTQWNFGRLENEVKEKALYYISQENKLNFCKKSNLNEAKLQTKAIDELRLKLLSNQPAEKKVTQYKLYKCEWNIGDVFAYRLESDMSKERGMYGRYLLIQKVDDYNWYPGHIVPIVYIKITDNTQLPLSVEEFNQLEFIQTSFTKFEERFLPVNMSCPEEDIAEKSKINYVVDDFGFLPQYRITLITTSKKMIPSKIIYLGNYKNALHPKNEFIPHVKENICSVFWKSRGQTFETKMIEKYCGHNLRELGIYNTIKQFQK